MTGKTMCLGKFFHMVNPVKAKNTNHITYGGLYRTPPPIQEKTKRKIKEREVEKGKQGGPPPKERKIHALVATLQCRAQKYFRHPNKGGKQPWHQFQLQVLCGLQGRLST